MKYSSLASGTMLIPKFLSGFQFNEVVGEKKLIVIQLSGGNDGLNTVIPFENDIYYNARKVIGVSKDSVLKLNDELGFNPVMEKIKNLFDDGLMSVINSVGYPNPDRSHFRSMDIWHTGSDAQDYFPTGWLGRYLDATCKDCANAYKAIELDDQLSLAMKGEFKNGLAMKDPEKLFRTTNDSFLVEASGFSNHDDEPNVEYLYKTMIETISSAEHIYEQSKIYKSTTTYPNHPFAKQVKQTAELICSGLETSVYYLSLSGFDTHIKQVALQEKLLNVVSESLDCLMTDLKDNEKVNDVMVMIFSEFGRRVKQNASNGTDHGTANNLFLISGGLKQPGFYNAAPDLSDLDDGDLKYQIDFRNIYATILDRWLGVNAEEILKQKFDPLLFI